MALDFDPEDKTSWYFGPLSREETNEIFSRVSTNGVFLVRESQSIKGDFVLCVREDSRISHYIINRIQVGGAQQFRIGDQQFPDIPSLLNFYKTHYLDTTALTVPAPRDKVLAKYDFQGKDPEDLPFRKGEILEVVSKDEEKWWTAKNKDGKTGQIPVPYVQKYDETVDSRPPPPPVAELVQPVQTVSPPPGPGPASRPTPWQARVIQSRIPNIYDKSQLGFQVGDIVTVLKTNANGQWEGEVNGRRGIFPFTHVQYFEEDNQT